jgi:hypothetical protein
MNFNQDGISAEQILRSLRAMIVDGGFKAQALIIDGLDFAKIDRDRIVNTKDFAKEQGLEVWYSCTVPAGDSQYTRQNIPAMIKDYVDLVDSVIVLEPKPDHISLSVSKDRETYNPASMALKLDPKTLLIQE